MIRFLTAGESHGKALTVIIDGLPSNLYISKEYFNLHLARRQTGYGRSARMKIEKDNIQFLSGIRFGKTIGSPISLLIENKDWIKSVLKTILDYHKAILDSDSFYLLGEEEWQWYERGKRALDCKHYDLAMEFFHKVITAEPESAGAYFYLGFAYLNKASTFTARRCFQKAFVLYFM